MARGRSKMGRNVSFGSVMCSVAIAVLLMAVSAGVEQKISASLAVRELQQATFVDVEQINRILHYLTALIIVSMLVQTAVTTSSNGRILMESRRREIGMRRQSGVKRSTLVKEFVLEMTIPVVLGGFAGEVLGVMLGWYFDHHTVLPVTYTWWSLLAPYPLTVAIAMIAVTIPAFKDAGRPLTELQVSR